MELLEKKLTEVIIGASIEVSNELGVGFLESVYLKALSMALCGKGLQVRTQVPMEVMFHGIIVGVFYADILVEKMVLVEVKASKALAIEHEAQLINYLKAARIRVGLLINFGRQRLEWKRMVF